MSAKKIIKILVVILLMCILNICGVGLFCYIIGWNSLVVWGNGLTVLSFIYIVIGAISIAGNYSARNDGRINYSRSTGVANLAKRTKQDMASTFDSFRFLILVWTVGFLSLILAWFIPTFNFLKGLLTFLQ